MEFRLPDVGEGIQEAEIIRWLVAVGDEVKLDQPILELQTDKALVEIPAPQAGRVLRLAVDEGQVVKVGTVLLEIGTADAGPANALPAASAAANAQAAANSRSAAQGAQLHSPAPSAPGRVLATPATRRLARELGVNLATLRGTGPAGRVTAEDVRNSAVAANQVAEASPVVAPAPLAAPVVAAPPLGQPQTVPVRGLRRRIAERLSQSWQQIPQVTHMDEVDVTELVALRQHLKEKAAAQGVKLTYLPFVIRALAAALRQFPHFNAHLDETGEQLTVYPDLNLGLATATKEGLLVPVIRQAQQKGLLALAQEIERLSSGAMARTLATAELRGSTFTISNVGPLGGLFATPLVNPPEVAILALHRIKEQPAVYRGQIAIRQILTLSLSFDHRIIDGADAVQFTNVMAALLSDPTALLLE